MAHRVEGVPRHVVAHKAVRHGLVRLEHGSRSGIGFVVVPVYKHLVGTGTGTRGSMGVGEWVGGGTWQEMRDLCHMPTLLYAMG